MNVLTYAVPVNINVASDDNVTTVSDVPIRKGEFAGIVIDAPNLEGSHTYTVTITDKNGATVFTRGSLTEDSVTSIFTDSNNFPLETPLLGDISVKVETSATEEYVVVS